MIYLYHTPQSLGNGKQGEIDTFDCKIKFGIRNPSENDIGDQVTSLENQICFTKESRSVYLKTILSDIQNDLDYTKYNRSNNKFMFFTIKKCLFELVDSYQNALSKDNQDTICEYENKIKNNFSLTNPEEILQIKILDSEDRMERPDAKNGDYACSWIKDFNDNNSHKPDFETPDYWPQDGIDLYKEIPNNFMLLAFYREEQIEY